MKKLRDALVPHIPYLLLMVIAHVVVYSDYWTGYRIIAGRDFLFLEATTANFSADCLRGGSFALWNPFINFGFPWVEHYLNTSLSFTHLLTTFTTGSSLEIVQRQLFTWILLGGIGIYLAALELGASKVSAMIAGICFMFSSQIFLLPRENYMIYNACTFPFLIYGYLRAKRKDAPFSLISIFFLTQYLLGGYMATGVLGLYLLAFYVLIDCWYEHKVFFAVKHLAATYTVSFLLALPKLLPVYLGMKSGPRLAGDTMVSVPDPFNLLSSYDLMSLLIPVKYFFSVYIGVIGIVVVVYCLVRKRIKIDALIILAVLSGWLLITDSNGNLSLLRKASYYLPMLKLVRVEWLHWYFPSIFFLLYSAQFIDKFLFEEGKKLRVATIVVYLAVVTAIFLWQYNIGLHYQAYIVTVLTALAWLLAPFLVDHARRPLVFAVVATIVLVIEFGTLVARVDINEPALSGPGFIRIQASDQWFVSHSFMDDNLVRKIKTLQFRKDDKRPSIDDARKWPHLVSAIDAQFNENLIVDLFNGKRFAGWFNNVQAKHEFIQMFDSPDLAAMDGQPLYLSLDRTTGMPLTGVSLDSLSCSEFVFTKTPTGPPSFLLLHQMYDDRWSVYVDGAERKPVKANKYFMGLDIEAGAHRIQFKFKDKIFGFSLMISLFTLAGIVISKLWRIEAIRNYIKKGNVGG